MKRIKQILTGGVILLLLIGTVATAAFYQTPKDADATAADARKQNAKIELKKNQEQQNKTSLRATAITDAGPYNLVNGEYTLDNVTLTTGLNVSGNVTLTLTGSSSITVTGASPHEAATGGAAAFYVAVGSSLTINGTGTLTLSATSTNTAATGLYNDGNVTLQDGATVIATGSTTSTGETHFGKGVFNKGSYTQTGGTLKVDGGNKGWGFYNSASTDGNTPASISITGGTITNTTGGTATAVNAHQGATINVSENANVDVDPGLQTDANKIGGTYIFAPYFTLTESQFTGWTAQQGATVELTGTGLTQTHAIGTVTDHPFTGQTFDNITHVIINGTGIVPTSWAEEKITFTVPSTLPAGQHKVQVRFQISIDASNQPLYLTKNIGTLTVTEPVSTGTHYAAGTHNISGTIPGPVSVADGAILNLTGDATVTVNGATAHGEATGGAAALYVPVGATLTITGTGTLTLTATSTNTAATGLYNDGNVTLQDGATVIATGSTTSTGETHFGKGVFNKGTYTQTGGTLKVDGGSKGWGFYNSESTAGQVAASITVSAGTITGTDGGTATVVNTNTAAVINVGESAYVDVSTNLHTPNAGLGEEGAWHYAPYYTITGDSWTVQQNTIVIIKGTGLGQHPTISAGPLTNYASQFDNIKNFILVNDAGVPTSTAPLAYADNGDSITFNAPATTGTYKVLARFQVSIQTTTPYTPYYLTENIGTLTVTEVPAEEYTVTISSTDEEVVTVTPATATVIEDATLVITATLDNDVEPEGTFTLKYTSDDGITATEIPAYDEQASPAQTFYFVASREDATNTPLVYTLTVTGISDDIAITVDYEAPATEYNVTVTATTGINIETGKEAGIVEEGEDYVFKVTLSPELQALVNGEITITVTPTDGAGTVEVATANEGEYTVTIPAVVKTIAVHVTYAGDEPDLPLEDGSITLVAGSNLTFEDIDVDITNGEGSFTITHEIPEGTFTYSPDIAVSGGWNSGTYTGNVTGILTSQDEDEITVDYTLPPFVTVNAATGIAVSYSDGTETETGVYLPDGEVTITATVTTITNYELRVSVNGGTVEYPIGTPGDTDTEYEIVLDELEDGDVVTITYVAKPTVKVTRPAIGSLLSALSTSQAGLTPSTITPLEGVATEGEYTFYVKTLNGAAINGTISVLQGTTELIGNPGATNATFELQGEALLAGSIYKVTLHGVTSNADVNVTYVARPTVTVTADGINVSKTTGAVETDGTFNFTASLEEAVNNGKITVTLTTNSQEVQPTFTLTEVDDKTFNITVSGIEVATTVNVSYEQVAFSWEVVSAADNTTLSYTPTPTSGSNVDTGSFSFNVIGAAANGKVYYAFTTTEDGQTSVVDATYTETTARNVTVKLPTGNKSVTNIKVTVGYVAPDDVPTYTPPVKEPVVVITPADRPVANAAPGEVAITSKPEQVNENSSLTESYKNKGSIVPGGKIETTVPVSPAAAVIATPQTVVITFSGPLAVILPSIEVPNVEVNHSELRIVYIFDNSTKSALTTRALETRAARLRAGENTSSYGVYDPETNTLYIHLVDIDIDAIGEGGTSATLDLKDLDIPVGEVNTVVTLYDHPVVLVPDNGVPSIGYPGYFTLSGSYPTDGQLVYRLENDPNTTAAYKSYYPSTGLLQSEIARLANGEKLYFAILGAVAEVGDLYVYIPKTYDNIAGGGSDGGSYIPSLARNVFISATASSEGLLKISTASGITTDGTFQFTITPTELLPGYELVLHFYKDWLLVGSNYEPTATGLDKPNADGTYTVTLTNIKVSDLQIVVEYRQGTVGNASVGADKVWANGNTLFINSNTNGTAKVYSIAGGLVKTVKVDANTLTTTDLPAGTYIVTLNGKSHKVNTK